jgi:hypothetical protein
LNIDNLEKSSSSSIRWIRSSGHYRYRLATVMQLGTTFQLDCSSDIPQQHRPRPQDPTFPVQTALVRKHLPSTLLGTHELSDTSLLPACNNLERMKHAVILTTYQAIATGSRSWVHVSLLQTFMNNCGERQYLWPKLPLLQRRGFRTARDPRTLPTPPHLHSTHGTARQLDVGIYTI